MRTIKENHFGMHTILAFALIPLSGFATDIFIPSLPSMASQLHTSSSAVQLTILLFMVSGGISQLFVGAILDSFGRYRIGLAALLTFAIASFAIAFSGNIYAIYAMRIIQGIAVALIVVSKRAYFVDIYSGDKLKHYVSLFSIIWATAPIVAPFLGGYLQASFGWRSNFYFLGGLTIVLALLEILYSGESLKAYQPFKSKSIIEAYREKLKTKDFTVGLFILALSYSLLVVYGLVAPFIIEHVFHYSPVVTGYCSLLSGIFLLMGGITSKILIKRDLLKKVRAAIAIQLILAIAMIGINLYAANLFTLIAFTLVIHMTGGFIYNTFLSYCLGRFSKNAGMTSGLAGGGSFFITSVISYSIVNTVLIKSPVLLGGAYLGIGGMLVVAFFLFNRFKKTSEHKSISHDVKTIMSEAA
jgi:DHA1 family bicyclomycin/chloramphenicol resistance-like MFS transporter